MSNAARKARKRAGVKFVRAPKVPTTTYRPRKEKPLALEQWAKIMGTAEAIRANMLAKSRADIPTFPDERSPL